VAKDDAEKEKRGGRWLLFLGALLLGVPLLLLCGLTLVGPPTAETSVFTVAVLVGVVGGLAAPWQKTAAWGARIAFVILFLVVVYRFFAAEAGTTIRAYTGPHGGELRWTARIVPERDVALGGSNLLMALDAMGPEEPGLLEALRDGYDRMRRAEGPVPSAVVGTFLFGQTYDEHTVLRIAPTSRFNPPEGVVLFLHGFIGNVTLECWQVAQAANPVGVDVVCPSTGWRARWAEPDGRAIVEATIAQLRAQGARRVYLAGLSAGGIGASRLARDVDVDGLILISGASRQARPARIPTLVLQGRRDPRTPPAPARRYARLVGRRATYEEHPEAGHWMILSHHEWTTERLRRWLAEQEGLGEVHDD
jgi:hypothetical protein